MAKPATTFTALRTPLMGPDGSMSWTWQQWFLDAQNRIQNGLDQLGQFIGKLTQKVQIEGRSANLGTLIENIDDTGVITGNGIDFSRPYLNKTTDYIADGAGSPLAGGKVAHSALVASAPTSGNALLFSGKEWSPAQVSYTDISGTPVMPHDAPVVLHQWVNGFSAATGEFTESQPDFRDLSGSATAAQIPSLNNLSGQITTAQLPASGFTGSATLAKLTSGGANGSLTIQNGIITAVVEPT